MGSSPREAAGNHWQRATPQVGFCARAVPNSKGVGQTDGRAHQRLLDQQIPASRLVQSGDARARDPAVDAAYLFRKASRGKRAAAPTKGPAAPREATDLGRLERYRSEFAAISGNFWDGAIVTWDVLFVRQAAEGITGDLLEIGVLKGKSATLIALHARADETFVLVDPALRREAIDAVESIRSAHNVLVRDVSQNLRGHAALAGREGSFRWIHIDGEHSGPAVTNDLEICRGADRTARDHLPR
jgi:hypothetical protein